MNMQPPAESAEAKSQRIINAAYIQAQLGHWGSCRKLLRRLKTEIRYEVYCIVSLMRNVIMEMFHSTCLSSQIRWEEASL